MGKRGWPSLLLRGGVALAMIAALTTVALIGGRSGTPGRNESARRSERATRASEGDRPGEARSGHESSVRDPLAGYSGWFFGQRAAPGRHVPAGAWAAAARKTQGMKAAALRGGANELGAPTWQNLGPAPTNQDVKTYSDPVWSNWGGGIYRMYQGGVAKGWFVDARFGV